MAAHAHAIRATVATTRRGPDGAVTSATRRSWSAPLVAVATPAPLPRPQLPAPPPPPSPPTPLGPGWLHGYMEKSTARDLVDAAGMSDGTFLVHEREDKHPDQYILVVVYVGRPAFGPLSFTGNRQSNSVGEEVGGGGRARVGVCGCGGSVGVGGGGGGGAWFRVALPSPHAHTMRACGEAT